MNLTISRREFFAAWLCWTAICTVNVNSGQAESSRVVVAKTPHEGIQPQAVADATEGVHLIYYKGNPRAGDIFYVRQNPGESSFSAPIRVNSRPGSAIAVGSIRGAHLALGKDRRVHVAWLGGGGAAPAKVNGTETTPMVYARMQEDKQGFEPERNVLTYAAGLDGGGSVAADPQGNVYVAWHANVPGSQEGEAGRAVFIAHSSDDGRTFEREKQANPQPTGACACCGLRAFADSRGRLYVLYRSAIEKANRDEILLVSRDRGTRFEMANLHKWAVRSCPMSSAYLTESKAGTLGAWETEGQVFFATIDPTTFKTSQLVSPPGTGQRKHPVVAENVAGETLLAWTEGTGWDKGGSVAWQVFDRLGRPLEDKRSAPGKTERVPVWGLVAADAKPDGTFVIVY